MSSNGLLKERLFKYHFAGGEWRVSTTGEYRVSVSVVSRLFAFELFLAFVFPWDNRYTNTETSLIWNERVVAVCRSGVQATHPCMVLMGPFPSPRAPRDPVMLAAPDSSPTRPPFPCQAKGEQDSFCPAHNSDQHSRQRVTFQLLWRGTAILSDSVRLMVSFGTIILTTGSSLSMGTPWTWTRTLTPLQSFVLSPLLSWRAAVILQSCSAAGDSQQSAVGSLFSSYMSSLVLGHI